jgi:hypothetical protein
MRYYIVTTTKFAEDCIKFLTYGSTQSNWLANVNAGDIIYLSQFNYKSQSLFGPFTVLKELFHNKTIIYPQQSYFYRIRLKPIEKLKKIEETDLYINGIKLKNEGFYFGLINLIQQNKHLHCICLTQEEGEAIFETFKHFGLDHNYLAYSELPGSIIDVNCKYLWDKNKLDKKRFFSSESDLESYIIFSLKKIDSEEYENINKLLGKYRNNQLRSSNVHNQFIFGNAYPSDIAILNKNNINVLELKKDKLSNSIILQIEKEIKKHLCYSLFSHRIESKNIERFNFYLIFLRDKDNNQFKQIIFEKYNNLCKQLDALRENNITFVEYYVKDSILYLEEV